MNSHDVALGGVLLNKNQLAYIPFAKKGHVNVAGSFDFMMVQN